MDREELELVRTSVLALLGSTPPAGVPTALADLGWSDLMEAEPAAATTALAECQGRVLAPTPALDLVVLHAAGLELDGTTAVVHPAMRRTVEPAAVGGVVDGLVLAGAQRAQRFLAPAADGLVELAVDAVTLTPVGGADPDLGLSRARGRVARDAAVAEVGWDVVVTAAQRHLAAELVGVAEQMLDDAVAYVQARHQFGRPIGVFQTVKHRLADVKVGVETARAVLGAAWQDGTATSAQAAKVLAATAHRLAATHGQQVQGGIAFTTEHGFHRFIERGRVLDGLYGRSDDLLRELGQGLLDSGTVPRTPQLVEAGGGA